MGIPLWFSAGGTGIDTALDYGDEPIIGSVLKSLAKPRSSYFLTTKIPTKYFQPNQPRPGKLDAAYALSAVKQDVQQLGIGRIDLVLIHHPASDAENVALWQGLESAVALNLTRSIGLSNFNEAQVSPPVSSWRHCSGGSSLGTPADFTECALSGLSSGSCINFINVVFLVLM